eukprot:gene25824-11499_t
MAYKASDSISLEDQIKRICMFVSVACFALSGVGYYYRPTGAITASTLETRSDGITSVLMKLMTTVAEDLILRHPEDVPIHTAFMEQHTHHGHSPGRTACGALSHALLSAAPTSNMYLFDPFVEIYSEKIVSILSRVFTERFNFIQGKPTDSLAWYKGKIEKDEMASCDLSAVDFSNVTALSDLITRVGGIIMVNEMAGFEEAWKKFGDAGYVKNVVCDEDKAARRKWCYGTVSKQSGSLDSEVTAPTETALQGLALSRLVPVST